MKIKMPDEVKDSINRLPFNITVKKKAIMIYAALYSKSYLKNSVGYFPVPSEYLKSISLRYKRIINHFIKDGIIDYYKRATYDENDIFNVIYKKYYNTEKGICMKYRFLINIEKGKELEVNMITYKSNRWYEIIENSLIENGFEVNISRDSFGRRVHHSAIKNYKEDFKGYYMIDAVTSQPWLLYNHLKNKNIIDIKYNYIFENDLDFYKELCHELKLESRQDAKDLFMHWLNGNGYVPNTNIYQLFPIVSSFLKEVKNGNYKNSSSLLQRIESKIWIDDILNNIPCDWALPIHDCIILKEKDVDRVYDYIAYKYPWLKIKKEKIT
jgi:hypothetical protein